MGLSKLLPNLLGTRPGTLNVVLFSQSDCSFCEEARENYLKPLAASRPAGLVVAEVEIDGSRRVKDWTSRSMSDAEFAKLHHAQFAPTVMFLGPRGEALAAPIVGLSRDFFGAYLDSRITVARQAGASAPTPASPT
jgi:hypothetical protein